MYGSLQELCELEEKSGKPFWKIVQNGDRWQGAGDHGGCII